MTSITDNYFETIFELSPDAIIITNPEGAILEANSAFLKFSGFSGKALTERNIADLFDDKEKTRFDNLMLHLRNGYTITEYDITITKIPDGPFVWEINAIPIKEADSVSRIIFIAHDITSRMQMQGVWRTLSSIVESSDDAIIGKDLDGTIVSWNKGAERIYGYTEDEVLGRSVTLLLPPDRQHEVADILEKIKQGERFDHFETVRQCKKGKLIDVSLTISPIKNDTGEIIGASAIARDITEEKKTRKALGDSEKRYRGLVESQFDLIVRVKPDGTFTFANDAYLKKFGKSRGHLIGKSFVPLVHEDDIGVTLEAMKGLEEPPYRIYVEQRAMTVDGWRWIAWEDYAIKDENGETTEIQAIGRDITERKRAELALTESQKKYRNVFDKANDYLVLLDSRGNVLELNERIESGMGYNREELIGQNIHDLPFLPQTEAQKAIDHFQKRVEGQDVSTYELVFVKKNGERLIGEVNATLIELSGGQIIDLVVIRDITERKKAEQDRTGLINKLREKTVELNTILESIGEAIVTTDRRHVITSVNKAFGEMIGLTTEEVPGKTCMDILACTNDEGNTRCDTECSLQETLDRNETTSLRTVIRDSKGRPITVDAITAPLLSAEGDVIGAVISIRDVSKEAEIERMKNEFVSTVSHELRTPLTSIKGYVDLILDGDTGDVSELQREFLDIISQSTDRLTLLINDLLDIEKIESGKIALKKKMVSLTELVDMAFKTMEPDAGDKGLGYTVNVERDIEITADPDRIMQVLMNLISNAIKFTQEGSVAVDLTRDKDHAVVCVRDTGIGIDKADQMKLFTKFFRAEEAYALQIGGTGLGLSIVKSLVEMHGGYVEVASEPGKGSTFTVRLPLNDST